jgi:uncharacterized membrane protein HdeD (DUF308 family)
LLMYGGIRGWLHRQLQKEGGAVILRSGSSILVGILILVIPMLPLRYADILLALAGGVLVVRGLVSGILMMRESSASMPR